jgi:hypothetical protein
VVRQLPLRSDARAYGPGCVIEYREKAIALCLHLDAMVRVERCAQEPAVIFQHVNESIAEPVQQCCGALNVGEKECD